MTPLTSDDYQLILRAIRSLEEEHRAAREEAETKAADTSYEFRREALNRAKFHDEERNKLGILAARIHLLTSHLYSQNSIAKGLPSIGLHASEIAESGCPEARKIAVSHGFATAANDQP